MRPLIVLADLAVRPAAGLARATLRAAETALELALGQALRSRLVEDVAQECARSAVMERFAGELLAGDAADRVAARILASPELERVLVSALDSPDAERLLGRMFESRMLDAAVAGLLESEELWAAVEEIAKSPAVTDAISHQGIGLADQVAGVVRDGSRSADTRLEHFARRVLRRRGNGDLAAGAPVEPAH